MSDTVDSLTSQKDELVTVRVNSIDDMGVLCSLLEYDDLEGFLPLSEISRKRMRSVLRVRRFFPLHSSLSM